MNDFVAECRTEWRRLGVPDPVADEMAADLAADLEEAAAEGATPEDVLGAGAFDARAFASAWAAERGVISQPRPSAGRCRRQLGRPAAIAVLALVAIVGAVLVIVASPSAEAPRGLVPPPPVAADGIVVSPDGRSAIWVTPGDARIGVIPGAAPRVVQIEPTVAASTGRDSSETARIVGSVLLGVALGMILLATLFWWWRGGDRVPSRHAY